MKSKNIIVKCACCDARYEMDEPADIRSLLDVKCKECGNMLVTEQDILKYEILTKATNNLLEALRGNDYNWFDMQGVSSSIRQIVKVIEHIAQSRSESGIRRKVSEAINAVAKNEGITASSVHAKVTRKLGLSMKQFKDYVEDYFNNNDETLKEILQSACVGKTQAEDNAAIEELFEFLPDWID